MSRSGRKSKKNTSEDKKESQNPPLSSTESASEEHFSKSQVQDMIKNASANQLHKLETLKLLTQNKSNSDYSSLNFTVRSLREYEILNGRKNFKSWKRMIINDLDALELSKCILTEDGDDNWTEQHRKKMSENHDVSKCVCEQNNPVCNIASYFAV